MEMADREFNVDTLIDARPIGALQWRVVVLAMNLSISTLIAFGALPMLVAAGYGYADVTAYQGATLIDGTHRGAVENATVLVEGDKFVAAGTDVAVPEGAKAVDVSGKWIVPGLIDSHVHFMTSGACTQDPPLSI